MPRQRAIVIGGSMSGLMAARVLANHFQDVLLFDRDALPAAADNRKGVPQGQHAHALLSSGRQVLEAFFPGLKEELYRQGALKGDYRKVRWFDNGVYHTRFDGLEALVISRPRLESHVRARLRALPNVTIHERKDVDALAEQHGRVTGATIAGETIDADLVVDASGRGSQSPAWLHKMGFPRPHEDAVKVGLAYSTRVYRRKPEHLKGDLAVICTAAPPAKRGGVALAMEDDRWMVTLFGVLGDDPPTDEQAFLEYAKSLPAPDVHEVISQAMSTAALQAAALEPCLAAGDAGLAKRFFAAASKVIDGPWTMAVGGDLRYAEVEGERTGMMKFINWYIGKLHIAAAGDPAVALAFHRVANLLDPPPSIMKPGIALRILHGNMRKPAMRH